MRPHRIGNTDTAGQQRGQAHQRQEQSDIVQEPVEPRGRAVKAANSPAGVGEIGLKARAHLRRRLAARHAYIIFMLHQASRLHQFRGLQRLVRHQHARPDGREANGAVRLLGDGRPHLESCFADFDAIADVHLQTRQQRRVDCRAVNALTRVQRLGEGPGG